MPGLQPLAARDALLGDEHHGLEVGSALEAGGVRSVPILIDILRLEGDVMIAML